MLLPWLITSVVIISIHLGAVSLLAMFCIWWERKIAGWIQSRLGPTHVGPYGLFQPVADGVKLLFKEDLTPRGADTLLFQIAPYLAFAPVFGAFVALPFGPNLIFEENLNIGVLYVLAIIAVEVMGVILAGWSSNSKWSVYGAMRVACQMVSYEVPMGLSILTVVLTAGTLHLGELTRMQADGWTWWLVFRNPFTFLAFIVFFISSLAANKRAPFDLPESESELVAGFHTEYSGLRFSFFFFAEYAGMFVMGAIIAALFLGGWNSPLGNWDPILRLTGYTPSAMTYGFRSHLLDAMPAWQSLILHTPFQALGMEPAKTDGGKVAQLVAHEALWKNLLFNLYCFCWFVFKSMSIVFVQMWVRWTLPRIRIDQVMHACIKVLLPLSLISLVGAATWVVFCEPSEWVHEFTDEEGPLVHHPFHDVWRTPHDPIVHLTSVQGVTQIILAFLGGLFLLACLRIVGNAYFSSKQPSKSFFDDVKVGPGETFRTDKNPAEPPLPATTG